MGHGRLTSNLKHLIICPTEHSVLSGLSPVSIQEGLETLKSTSNIICYSNNGSKNIAYGPYIDFAADFFEFRFFLIFRRIRALGQQISNSDRKMSIRDAIFSFGRRFSASGVDFQPSITPKSPTSRPKVTPKSRLKPLVITW